MLIFSRKTFILAITSAFSIIAITATNTVVRYPDHSISDSILNDLPKRTDLILYIRALDRILSFMEKNKHYIDINFTLGLFLVNVNLKNIIKVKQKLLPVRFRNRLNDIVKKTDALLKYFDNMVTKDKTSTNKKNKLIYSLFTNQSQWVDRIRKFNIWKQVHMLSAKELEDKYTKWNNYMKSVEQLNEWTPKPRESDKCMVSLAKNPINRVEMMTKCNLADSCYDILMNGSDFGYALSHRLLLLLVARYGRGCVVFTPFLDRELTRRFCTASYGEAEYISMHGYQLPDLLLEQISLCGLDGHTQFVRRSWMKSLLQFQSAQGCFGKSSRKVKRELREEFDDDIQVGKKKEGNKKGKKKSGPEWRLTRQREFVIGPGCTAHITAVAATSLATALKFLLMSYF